MALTSALAVQPLICDCFVSRNEILTLKVIEKRLTEMMSLVVDCVDEALDDRVGTRPLCDEMERSPSALSADEYEHPPFDECLQTLIGVF